MSHCSLPSLLVEMILYLLVDALQMFSSLMMIVGLSQSLRKTLHIPGIFSDVTAILSLGNPAGTVSEDNGAMLVLVTLEGQLSTDIALTVQTFDGSG